MKPKFSWLMASVGLWLATAVSPVAGQREYHWSDQFGNRSTLLNGTVIGGVSGLGAVFYNPGRLAQLDRPGFLLTAEAFEVTEVEVRFEKGETNEVEQANFRGIPSLAAGMFTLPFLPGQRFAYSFLNRRRSSSDLFLGTEGQQGLPESSPGGDVFLSTWESISNLSENWVGLSWASEISSRVSIGISTFGTYVGQRRRAALDFRILTSAHGESAFTRLREYRFSSYGVLWKAGLAANLGPFELGLSFTTPQITAFGSGSIRYENLQITPESSDGSSRQTDMVVFQEGGISAETKSPSAVGGGLSWVGRRGGIHLSGEWYSGVSQHLILEADSIRSQSSGDLHRYQVVDELKPVFNFGVGVEWQISDAVGAYGSIVRDAGAGPDDPVHPFAFSDRVNNSVSQEDGFYVGVGAAFEAEWVDLTIGFTRGAVEGRHPNPLNAVALDFGHTDSGELLFSRRRWRFLLGFSIPLVEEFSDEAPVGLQ